MKRKLTSRIFNPNTVEARRVIKEISAYITTMSRDYLSKVTSSDPQILEQLKLKYAQIFDSKAHGWATRISGSALKSSEIQFRESLKDLSENYSIGRMDLTDNIKETFKLITNENASLFKTIPQQYHTKVANVVFDAYSSGSGAQDVYRYIKKFDNQTKNYTQLRTLDQTRKAFSALSRERMVAAGIKKFQWVHSGGVKEPRKLHQALNGKIFDIDNPPYIGTMYDTDVYGYPGQMINCHCKQRFVFAEA